MNDVLLNILGILALVFFIFISIGLHEFGHLRAAKHYGVKVTEFMIGFGPRIYSRQRGETEYGAKAVPLGGYVRIVGMYPPEKSGQAPRKVGRFSHLVDQAREESLVGLAPGEEDRVFYKLPVHQRIVVMMAGPFTNLGLAFLFFTVALVGVGLPVATNTLGDVVPCVPTSQNPTGSVSATGGCPNSTATASTAAGLESGDTIVGVDGRSIDSWDTLRSALESSSGLTVLAIEAEGVSKNVTVELEPVAYPVIDDEGEATGETTERVFLGIRPAAVYEPLAMTEVPVFMWDMTERSVGALVSMPARLFALGETLVTNGERDPEGPVSVVGVGRLGGEIAAADQPVAAKVGSIFALAASLNLFLFLFNLVPILPLDGGHVAAALWESARRRIASWRGRPDPGVVDTARLLPVTYAVVLVLVGVGVMVIWADLFKPITLGG